MTATPDPSSLVAASNAAPALDPQSIIAATLAGRSQSQAAAVGAATATANYGQTTTQAQNLTGLTPQQQNTVWHGLTQQEQQQLTSVGYQPAPLPKAAPGGMWSGLVHDVSSVADTVGHAVGTGLHDTSTSSPLRCGPSSTSSGPATSSPKWAIWLPVRLRNR